MVRSWKRGVWRRQEEIAGDRILRTRDKEWMSKEADKREVDETRQ